MVGCVVTDLFEPLTSQPLTVGRRIVDGGANRRLAVEITFDRKSINTCLQQRFTLPSYQREYRWETKHLQELLEDIQDQFLSEYDSSHGRSKVGEYKPYFLGTIITTTAQSGMRSIVDGQQRLTTLTLILAYFLRLSKSKPELSLSDAEPLIRRRVYGDSHFNLELDPDRKSLLEALLDRKDLIGDELDAYVESIPNLSPGTRDMYNIFNNVDGFILDYVKEGLMDRLLDYLIERVYLFEIGVPSEQDGHKVFVTMNDRGLRLAPLDLLKGYLLSNISDPKANGLANHKWADCIRQLRSIDRDEDSAFFKTWLRAQYAKTTRGKSRGDSAADFEVVGDAYHRWVVDNAAIIGLNNSDDFYDLVERKIPFFVAQYKRLRAAEENFTVEFPHVYYNGAKNISLQYMAILAALNVDDTSAVIDKKIRLISFYIDAFLTSRVITRRGNNYDNIKDLVFSLTRRVRHQSIENIVEILTPMMEDVKTSIESVDKIHYWTHKRQDVLHFLARIAAYLEDEMDITNKVGFAEYISRGKGNKTFDIEHAAPYNPGISLGFDEDGVYHETSDVTAFSRNYIGTLLLLQRGRNRSMQDMSYPDKLVRYSTENILASSMTESFYLNNPTVTTYIIEEDLPIRAEPALTPEASSRRVALYTEAARRIWNVDCLERLAT